MNNLESSLRGKHPRKPSCGVTRVSDEKFADSPKHTLTLQYRGEANNKEEDRMDAYDINDMMSTEQLLRKQLKGLLNSYRDSINSRRRMLRKARIAGVKGNSQRRSDMRQRAQQAKTNAAQISAQISDVNVKIAQSQSWHEAAAHRSYGGEIFQLRLAV